MSFSAPGPDASAPRRHLPVWLPWLAAPAFALLPMAGCGAAAAVRNGRVVAREAAPAPAPPLVPITAVVTVIPPGR